jgi:hypothetical protein
MGPRSLKMVLSLALLLASAPALGRPYRLVATQTPRSTGGGNLEVGGYYEGFFLGDGRLYAPLGRAIDPQSFQEIGATVRWGIIKQLELGLRASAILFHKPGAEDIDAAFGDLVASLQGRFLTTRHHLLGLYTDFSIPTGPADVDALPPFWSDGTFDFEILALYELAYLPFRLAVDAGYVHAGTRTLASGRDFDVPDAFRWDLAVALNLFTRFLFSLELGGRHYVRADVTPFWVDNANLVELTPAVRIETIPRLVFEAGIGFGLTRDAREMFLLHARAGVTYEFNMY